jgi:hypothetical protein
MATDIWGIPDGFCVLEVSDSFSHFQDAVMGAGGKPKAADGAFQKLLAIRRQRAILANLAGGHLGAGVNFFALISRHPAFARFHHAPESRLAACIVAQLAILHGWYIDVNVDAGKQRSQIFAK